MLFNDWFISFESIRSLLSCNLTWSLSNAQLIDLICQLKSATAQKPLPSDQWNALSLSLPPHLNFKKFESINSLKYNSNYLLSLSFISVMKNQSLWNQGQMNNGAESVAEWRVTSRRHHRLRPPAPLSNGRRRLSSDGWLASNEFIQAGSGTMTTPPFNSKTGYQLTNTPTEGWQSIGLKPGRYGVC